MGAIGQKSGKILFIKRAEQNIGRPANAKPSMACHQIIWRIAAAHLWKPVKD
jgi:hypothetical protein